MPIPIDLRTSFIERHLVDEFGRPLHVKPWMLSHVIDPLDGHQTWRRGERLCATCRAQLARIVSDPTAGRVDPHDGCDGVEPHKIIVSLLNLKRQQGKTTTGAAYSLSELFLARNANILYLAAAEKQSARIFEAKWATPIRRNPKLASKAIINGDEIRIEKRGNYLRFVPTSAKSVPGGSWRLIIIDEARDVRESVAAALIPSIMSARGLECPYGHWTGEIGPGSRTVCPACNVPLQEWVGRLLIMSSSGEDTGWFHELVNLLSDEPQPHAYLFRSAETLNAHTSDETIAALESTFGRLPSMEGLMRRELHNEFTREGDEFLPAKAIRAVTSKDLHQAEASEIRCVGFLDCSRTNELTSLVLAGDPATLDERVTRATFQKLSVQRIDIWDPKQAPGGRVDYRSIRDHLEEMMPRFPGLLELAIDVSMIQDAEELYQWCRSRPWGGKIRAHRADRLQNKLMWDALEARVLAGPASIEIPEHKRLIEELKAARLKVTAHNNTVVVDSSRGDRRGRLHRDVSMALAGCCLLASKYTVRAAQNSAAIMTINNSVKLGARFKPITGGMKTETW